MLSSQERATVLGDMDSKEVAEDKPHAIIIPSPLQGHIKAMLDFAKLLHHKGFHITFVNSEFNHRRLLNSRGPEALNGLPGFKYESIPDGLPPSEADATQDILSLCEAIRSNFLPPFRSLLAKINHTATSNLPPVTCIISDGFMIFTPTVAQEFGIPIAMFFTIAACSFMGFKQFGALRDKGIVPIKDEDMDTILDWIPGMHQIRIRDLPNSVRTSDPNDFIFEFCKDSAEGASKGTALILHSFYALEQEVLDALKTIFPKVYAIGPLPLLLNQIQDPLKSIRHNLWKEDTECLQWLNSWQPNSVVYVNFGSITVTTPDQLIEFGWGLANSNQPFLWIIRPDQVIGDAAILPAEFVESTKGRGMVTSWCPQEQVLNHQAVGGFLTHCGWNSTIESICAGVPMLCWPFFGDQTTNCRYICREWEIGMEIDDDVKSDQVEELVRELMEGEKGKKMRSKVMEWKRMAEEATGVAGSSSMDLEKLVNEVLLSKNTYSHLKVTKS